MYATPLRGRAAAPTIAALVYARAAVVFQAGDFVLHMQLATLQLRELQAIRRRMRERLVELIFEGPMPLFEFRKMRFDRHVACLLAL